MTYAEIIKKRITELCDKRNISIRRLAFSAGIDHTTVIKIMNKISTIPNIKTLHYKSVKPAEKKTNITA